MKYKGEDSINYLSTFINKKDSGESSHWRKYNDEFNFVNEKFTGLKGFGLNNKYSFIYQFLSNILQRKFFNIGKDYNNIDMYKKKAMSIAKKQDRIFDLDFLRQALTLSFLDKKIGKCNTSFVIGDGFASLSSLLLESGFSKKVVLVNLNKQLMVDLYYLKLYLGVSIFNKEVVLITNKNDVRSLSKKNNNYSIIAIQAENHTIVRSFDIDLVLNIVSMGEMDFKSISEYFDDIRKLKQKNKNLYFYCCNRLEKRLPDGKVTNFLKYPWKKEDQVLVDEQCPWHKEYYHFSPPFYRKFDGPIIHQLRAMS